MADARGTDGPAVTRTVHVEHCMGTVFSIDVRDAGDWSAPVAEVVRWLHHVDEVFSTYRADSDISRLARGEAAVAELDPDVAVVLDRCEEIARLSGGAFSASPGGRLDPSGFVKGWAIDRAAALLTAAGVRNGGINGGGDMQLLGEAAPGRPWRVGISDPRDRTRVLSVVSGRDLAVATSATGERGRHIVDPRTGRAVDEVASVSVVGPRLAEVDAYATAAFVMGRRALDWIASLPGYEALVVHLDGTCRRTPGFPGTVPTATPTRTIVVSPAVPRRSGARERPEQPRTTGSGAVDQRGSTGSSTARHSTWAVIGNRSNARSARSS